MKKILILILICFYGCNQITMVDVYKEYFPKKVEGYIKEIEKYKGGGYVLKIESLKKIESIAINGRIGEKCQIDDYFIKIDKSNKCQLKRKDSIICFDCLTISKKDKDFLGKINEYQNSEKNYWRKIN